MELLVFVLNQPEYLEEILEGFLRIGIRGATVIDSTGMGRTLCDRVPIFGGIRSIIQGCRPNNLTIFTVVRSFEMRDKAVGVITEIMGDLSRPNAGFLFCVPVSMASGFAEKLEGDE
jgi:nitrogen regulatory protein P-II 1